MIKIMRYSKNLADKLVKSPGLNWDLETQRRVDEIIEQVRIRGDAAVLDYGQLFDGFRPSPIKVGEEEFEEAISRLDTSFLSILAQATENIKSFHKKQLRQGFEFSPGEGIILGQQIRPIERWEFMCPALPASSTVLMNAIPLAGGVPELIMCTAGLTGGWPAIWRS